jgi:hypothetical protein
LFIQTDIIKINDTIAPIKINTAIREKTATKNVSLGSATVSMSSINEFTVMIMVYLSSDSDSIYINIERKEVEQYQILLWYRFFNFY